MVCRLRFFGFKWFYFCFLSSYDYRYMLLYIVWEWYFKIIFKEGLWGFVIRFVSLVVWGLRYKFKVYLGYSMW